MGWRFKNRIEHALEGIFGQVIRTVELSDEPMQAFMRMVRFFTLTVTSLLALRCCRQSVPSFGGDFSLEVSRQELSRTALSQGQKIPVSSDSRVGQARDEPILIKSN